MGCSVQVLVGISFRLGYNRVALLQVLGHVRFGSIQVGYVIFQNFQEKKHHSSHDNDGFGRVSSDSNEILVN